MIGNILFLKRIYTPTIPKEPKQSRRETQALTGQRYISMDLVRKILAQIKTFGIKIVINSGGGEPFRHPDLIDILREESALGFEIGLFTNGSLMTKAQVEILMCEIKPAFIRISVNALGDGAHKKFHGYQGENSYFQTVTENVRYLAQLKLKYQSPVTLGISFIIGTRNVANMENAGRYIRSLVYDENGRQTGLLDYAVFRPEVIYARHKNHGMLSIRQQHPASCFNQFMAIFEDRIWPETADIPGFQAIANPQRFNQMASGQQSQCRRCLAHAWRLNVWYDGSVYLCTEHNGNPNFNIGNLADQSLEEIWFGERRRQVIVKLDGEFFQTSCPPICVQSDNNPVFQKVLNLPRALRERLREAVTVLQAYSPPPPHANFL